MATVWPCGGWRPTYHATFCAKISSTGRTAASTKGKYSMQRKRVLFFCTQNSAGSQMAEALLQQEAADRFEVFSAGTDPTDVRPEAIAVMAEIGIDIRRQCAKAVDEFDEQKFDYVITVCDAAKEGYPVFPGDARHLHWDFAAPAAFEGTYEERKAVFRRLRDQIGHRLKEFVMEHGNFHYAMHG